MDERKCNFCQAYKNAIALNREANNLATARGEKPYHLKTTATAHVHGLRTDCLGNHDEYRHTFGEDFKLNYCPECGRSLKKLRRNT